MSAQFPGKSERGKNSEFLGSRTEGINVCVCERLCCACYTTHIFGTFDFPVVVSLSLSLIPQMSISLPRVRTLSLSPSSVRQKVFVENVRPIESRNGDLFERYLKFNV